MTAPGLQQVAVSAPELYTASHEPGRIYYKFSNSTVQSENNLNRDSDDTTESPNANPNESKAVSSNSSEDRECPLFVITFSKTLS